MTSNIYQELDSWKTKAHEWKRQLDELIKETLSNRKKLENNEKQINVLIKEKETLEEQLSSKEKALKEILEEKEITKGNKMLLYQLLGTLDSINNLPISQGNKVKLLSKIVSATEKNLEKDFNGRGTHKDSPLSNVSNYTFLKSLSEELNITEWLNLAQSMLHKLENKAKK